MSKRINIRIDEVLKLLRELEQLGVKQHQYSLVSPWTRRNRAFRVREVWPLRPRSGDTSDV